MQNEFCELAKRIGIALEEYGFMLATAESCTGGQVAQVITSVSGSASWFERGFVTYSNLAKQEMLAVKAETLGKYGAVSEETAREMAEGALNHSHADVAVAVTGIAGPTGGTKNKPVGTVCFAWSQKGQKTSTSTQHFQDDRLNIRNQATRYLLATLIDFVNPPR